MTDTETRTVPLGGRQIRVKKLGDLQLVHLMRFAKILSSDSVAVEQKLDIVPKMLDVIHSIIDDPADLDYLEGLELAGQLNITDYLEVVRAFQDAPAKPVVRRGRPRKQQ